MIGINKTLSNLNNNLVKNYNNSFTMYAETDLDQPTDYSLRYGENDSDSECVNQEEEEETEIESQKNTFVQDTVKTYCTEDTPYETPFNFSTATSMSDLSKTDDKLEQKPKTNPTQNSGNNDEDEEEEVPTKTVALSSTTNTTDTANFYRDKLKDKVKAVKFEDVVNYAEETPLMFSRSSSLASLDSIEQHSIHDDISSVVSDLSRLTSGLISPSDIPDSPTQTVPPSPKPRKNYGLKTKITPPSKLQSSSNVQIQKATVFEDVVTKFKLESTPIEFSTATSLSSLTLDDHEADVETKNQKLIVEKVEDCKDVVKVDEIKEDDGEALVVEDEDDEDADMLAACINIGMQKNKYNQSESKTSDQLTTNLNKTNLITNLDTIKTYYTEDTPAQLSHAGSNSDLSVLSAAIIDHKTNILLPNVDSDNIKTMDNVEVSVESNSLEQSPDKVNVGNNDSNSASAAVPIDEEQVLPSKNLSRSSSLSSISSAISESEKALLQECILAGMPQPNRSKELIEEDINRLTVKEHELLRQCILDGMKKNQKFANENNELTENERLLLKECILAGMPKNKLTNTVGSSMNESIDLTETEQELLKECILAGMPKSKQKNPQKIKPKLNTKMKNSEPNVDDSVHKCCIHCPRNKMNIRQNVRMRKKSKDFNWLYVTRQILTLKSDLMDNSNEEWI